MFDIKHINVLRGPSPNEIFREEIGSDYLYIDTLIGRQRFKNWDGQIDQPRPDLSTAVVSDWDIYFCSSRGRPDFSRGPDSYGVRVIPFNGDGSRDFFRSNSYFSSLNPNKRHFHREQSHETQAFPVKIENEIVDSGVMVKIKLTGTTNLDESYESLGTIILQRRPNDSRVLYPEIIRWETKYGRSDGESYIITGHRIIREFCIYPNTRCASMLKDYNHPIFHSDQADTYFKRIANLAFKEKNYSREGFAEDAIAILWTEAPSSSIFDILVPELANNLDLLSLILLNLDTIWRIVWVLMSMLWQNPANQVKLKFYIYCKCFILKKKLWNFFSKKNLQNLQEIKNKDLLGLL